MSMFVFRQAVHIMVHVKLGAPQAKKILDVSSGFECGFNGFVSPLPTPCRRLLKFWEIFLPSFVNGTVC